MQIYLIGVTGRWIQREGEVILFLLYDISKQCRKLASNSSSGSSSSSMETDLERLGRVRSSNNVKSSVILSKSTEGKYSSNKYIELGGSK